MMKTTQRLLVATVTALLGMSLVCRAQFNSTQRTVEGLEITDIEFVEVLAPAYRPEGVFKGGREDHWLRIRLDYRLGGDDDDWIDRLGIQWYVAINPDDGPPLLLSTRILYGDVQGDEDHMAVVYVRPSILMRYYGDDTVRRSDIVVYVRMTINGDPAGVFHYNRDEAPDNWWQLREPNVTIRENELLPRTRTPFGPLDAGVLNYILEPR